jgi:hypothetical protein
MPRTVTQMQDIPKNDDFLAASARWEDCKPPYASSHIRVCVAAAKIILAHLGQARRSKYEKDNYLRIDFSKAGKVTFYAEFPKKMGLKGKKLGEDSYKTYCTRTKQIAAAFGGREVFSDVTYNRLLEVFDLWIETKSNNQALELSAELRRTALL